MFICDYDGECVLDPYVQRVSNCVVFLLIFLLASPTNIIVGQDYFLKWDYVLRYLFVHFRFGISTSILIGSIIIVDCFYGYYVLAQYSLPDTKYVCMLI